MFVADALFIVAELVLSSSWPSDKRRPTIGTTQRLSFCCRRWCCSCGAEKKHQDVVERKSTHFRTGYANSIELFVAPSRRQVGGLPKIHREGNIVLEPRARATKSSNGRSLSVVVGMQCEHTPTRSVKNSEASEPVGRAAESDDGNHRG